MVINSKTVNTPPLKKCDVRILRTKTHKKPVLKLNLLADAGTVTNIKTIDPQKVLRSLLISK